MFKIKKTWDKKISQQIKRTENNTFTINFSI